MVVVFPGVGEVCRYVKDELLLAVGASNHANVAFKDYSNIRLSFYGTPHVAASHRLVHE